MIYLDNAATTRQKPPQVIDAVVYALTRMGNAERGIHSSTIEASRAIYDARCKLADFFGCPRADHVIFTANSTEALNIAINGLFQPGDHVITTDLEHNSVLRPLYRLEAERQITLSFVSADPSGSLSPLDFKACIRPNTKAIICTHASNVTGNHVDIAQIGAIAHAHNLLFLVDASQTAGSVPIDMEQMHIDVLCFTGHKGLMGPQGTGGLCIRPGVEIHPWAVGGSGVQSYRKEQPNEYPTRLEAGTLNSHGILGLSAALDFINETGIEAISRHELTLMQLFYEKVSHLPGVTVYGDFTKPRSAIVALNIDSLDSGTVSDFLSQNYDIATRPGAHCAPRMHQALGTSQQGAVRFSFSWYNTEEDVHTAVSALEHLLALKSSDKQ